MKDPRREKAIEFVSHPDFMDELAVEIANGASLIDICQTRDLRYGDVWFAIKKDPEKHKLYQQAEEARGEWLVQRLLKELESISTVDIRDAFDEDGNLLSIKKMPAHVAAVLKSVEAEEDEDGNIKRKITLWDKLKSIELLGKKLAIFVDKHEIVGRLTLEDLVSKSREIPKVEHES